MPTDEQMANVKILVRVRKSTGRNKNWVNIRLHDCTEECFNLDELEKLKKHTRGSSNSINSKI